MDTVADQTATFRAVADFSKINRDAKRTSKELGDVGKGAQKGSAQATAAFATMAAAAKKSGEKAGENLTDPIKKDVDRLQRELKAKKLQVDLDDARVKKQIAEVQARIERTKGEIAVTADDTQLKRTLKEDQKLLNNLRGTARVDTAEARRDVQAMRAELTARKIELQANINAEADTAAANAELGIAARDRTSNIRVKTSGLSDMSGFLQQSTLSFGQIIALVAVLGSALIPVVAAAGAFAAAMAAGATAAGFGIGAFAASAIGNITQIVKAQDDLDAAQKTSASSAQSLASAQDGVASAMDGVKSAQAGVAQAQVAANRAVADAARNAAQVRQAADQQVQSARSALASAVVSADNSIEQAEQSLADAQDQARSAQDALTNAREAARQKLADYDMQLRGAALSEADARLGVRQAQQALQDAMTDPKATQLQIDLAKQALRQARFNYDQAKSDRKDLRKQAAADRKAGVEGDNAVKDAKENLADANRDVKSAEEAVAQTRVQAARDIAAAQQAVTDARVQGAQDIADAERQVARARADGATQVAAAQKGVVAARRQLASAQAAAATAAAGYATAQSDVADAMSKLDGPAAGFVKALDRAKGAWRRFLDATAGPVLGTARKGLRFFTNTLLPAMVPIAKGAATAIGDLFDEFNTFSKTPAFGSFVQWLGDTAGDMIRSFGRITMNTLIGLFGLFGAFAPLADAMIGGLEDLTARFRDWGLAANTNEGVRGFIDYALQNGPLVVAFLGNLFTALGHILQAFAPIGEVVLTVVNALLDFIQVIPPDVLTAIIAGILATAAAFKALSIAAVLVQAALAFGPVGLVFLAIAAAVGVLVGGLIVLYKRSETARKVMNTVWRSIKAGVKALGQIVKVQFRVMQITFRALGRAAVWLWKKAISPAFKAIGGMAKWLWRSVIKPVFNLIGAAVRTVGRVVGWLWKNAAKPALNALGSAFQWLWKKVVRPVMGWIGSRIRSIWNGYIKPVFGIIAKVLRGDLGGAWGDMKDLAARAVNGVWNLIKGLPGKLRSLGGKMLDAGKFLIKKMWSGLTNVGEFAANIGKGLANAVIGLLNKAIPDKLAIPGAPDINLPNDPIPELAKGGRASRDSNVIIGDGNEPESVLPDSMLQKLMDRVARIAAVIASGADSGEAAAGDASPKGAGKAVKKVGQTFQKVWKSLIRPALNAWNNTTRKRVMPTQRAMERQSIRSMNQVGKRLTGFTRKELRTFDTAWSRQFTKRSPADYIQFRKSVQNDTSRMTKSLSNGTTRIRNLFSNLASGLRNIWENQIRPVFRTLGQFIGESVAPIFRKGVDSITRAWSKLKGATARPVRFVLQTVINNGLVKGINKVAKFAGVDPMKPVKVPKFRKGGHPERRHGRIRGSGTPRQDNIPSMLSSNEHVWSAQEVRGAGGHGAVENLRAAALSGSQRRFDKPKHRGAGPRPQAYWTGGGVLPLPSATSISEHGTPYHGAWYASDMNGPYDGTPAAKIVSWKKGTVAYTNQSNESYGYETVLNHDDGNFTRYAHQLPGSIRVGSGQKVGMGHHIGAVGETGNASGAHLHFEIKGGKASPSQGLGGTSAPALPPWAQKISEKPKKWAQGLLDGGKTLAGSPWGQMLQASLNTMAGPVAGWATDQLSKAGAAAGNFGPGAKGVWKSLMSTGWYSPQQAAGVMGNIQSESGFVHNIVQGGGSARLPIGIDSGWGLVQWTPGHKVLPYLNGDGSVGSQIGALTAQLQGKGPSPEGSAGASLKATKTPEHAARVFGLEYERYAGSPQTNRETQARAIYEQFRGTAPKGTGSHDGGGVLGDNEVAFNRSGKDEYVLTNPQYRTWAKMLGAAERGRLPGGVGQVGALGAVGRNAQVVVQKTTVNAPVYTWHVHNPIPEKTSATTLKSLTSVAHRGLTRR